MPWSMRQRASPIGRDVMSMNCRMIPGVCLIFITSPAPTKTTLIFRRPARISNSEQRMTLKIGKEGFMEFEEAKVVEVEPGEIVLRAERLDRPEGIDYSTAPS